MEGDRIITISIRQRFLKEGHVFDLNSSIETTKQQEQQQITTKSKFKKRNYKNHVKIAGEYGSWRWFFWTIVNYILWIFSYFWLWYRGDDDTELAKNNKTNIFINHSNSQSTQPIVLNNNSQKLLIETENTKKKRKGAKTANKQNIFSIPTMTNRRRNSSGTTTNSGSWNGNLMNVNHSNNLIDYCAQEEDELVAEWYKNYLNFRGGVGFIKKRKRKNFQNLIKFT